MEATQLGNNVRQVITNAGLKGVKWQAILKDLDALTDEAMVYRSNWQHARKSLATLQKEHAALLRKYATLERQLRNERVVSPASATLTPLGK